MFEAEMQLIQDQKAALMRSMVENFQRDRNALIKLTIYQNELAARLQSTPQELSNKKTAPHWNLLNQGSTQKVKMFRSALVDIIQQVSYILTCESNATLIGMLEKEENKFIQAYGTAQANLVLEQCNLNKLASEKNEVSPIVKQEYSAETREGEETPKETEVPVKVEESDENESQNSKTVPRVNRKECQGFKSQCDPAEKNAKGKVKAPKKRNVLFEKLKTISMNPSKKEATPPRFDLKEALGSFFKGKIAPASLSGSEKDRSLVDEEF